MDKLQARFDFLTTAEDKELRRRLVMCNVGSQKWKEIRDELMGGMEPLIFKQANYLERKGFGHFEDNVQNIYLYLVKSFPRFDPTRNIKFVTWATYVVRGAVSQITQKRGIKLEYFPAEDFQTSVVPTPAKLNARKLFRYLKPNERLFIREYYLKGRTLKEIGEEYGCTKENVRQIKERALRKLRQKFPSPQHLFATG